MSLQLRLTNLATTVNNNGNPRRPDDYDLQLNFIKDLLIDGYAIHPKRKVDINRKIDNFKRLFPRYYTNDLLKDYNDIYKSGKLLLNINETEPIIVAERIIHKQFIDIPLEDDDITPKPGVADANPISIGPCAWPNPAQPDCKGSNKQGNEYDLFAVSIYNSVFERVNNQTIQTFFLAHEFTHMILEKFIVDFIPEFRKVNDIYRFGLPSNSIELYCDIIGIALVFISMRRDEEPNDPTGQTKNENLLYNDFTVDNLRSGWGGEGGGHPHVNVRYSYSKATFDSLRQIVNFNITPAKINEVREIIKTQMRRFWTQCYGIRNPDDLVITFDRRGNITNITHPYRCAGGALP
jgi:hypothetical protein